MSTETEGLVWVRNLPGSVQIFCPQSCSLRGWGPSQLQLNPNSTDQQTGSLDIPGEGCTHPGLGPGMTLVWSWPSSLSLRILGRQLTPSRARPCASLASLLSRHLAGGPVCSRTLDRAGLGQRLCLHCLGPQLTGWTHHHVNRAPSYPGSGAAF